ncbi:Altronate dehydratase [Caprobacter fermentans]|uniref:Altronate dehydratase n=1 Tax=Caproicibacter fermentans TaxID=2576756 RepID=A0A6N8I385_9FIRM|nr:UxaA family hydrolase [Caproicibacter fermentans]MVB12482.1 Altronate dehydratase [Caproicibacter fermentans]OCN01503.1 altronate hydrolase [Clostridium sp. W14A]QNK40570.1 UxaA family hydrolase [Caproicibacter fermentans]
MNAVIHINEKDNLVTCLRPIAKGETIEFEGKHYTASADIPKFHKMAVAEIKKGEHCYKYGEVIGAATTDLHPGDYVHVHNLESTRGRGDKHTKE